MKAVASVRTSASRTCTEPSVLARRVSTGSSAGRTVIAANDRVRRRRKNAILDLSETSLAKPSPSEALGREPTGRTCHVFKRGKYQPSQSWHRAQIGGDRCQQTRKNFARPTVLHDSPPRQTHH